MLALKNPMMRNGCLRELNQFLNHGNTVVYSLKIQYPADFVKDSADLWFPELPYSDQPMLSSTTKSENKRNATP
jgi:hypothetical protein